MPSYHKAKNGRVLACRTGVPGEASGPAGPGVGTKDSGPAKWDGSPSGFLIKNFLFS